MRLQISYILICNAIRRFEVYYYFQSARLEILLKFRKDGAENYKTFLA